MENIFEIQFNRDQSIYKEMYKYLCFKTRGRIFFDIIIILSFITNIILIMSGDNYTFSVLILAPAFFAIQIYQYFRAVKLSTKRQSEICPSENVHISVSVSDTGIISKASTGAETNTPLTKIKRIHKTKNLIMLQSEAKLIYIFPKNSFIKGTPGDFLSFLANKGLK